MAQEIHMKLCVTELDFSKKKIFAQKIGKMGQKSVKTGFFEFVEKFCH